MLPRTPTGTNWDSLSAPSVQTLIGLWDSGLLWVTEQIYKGKCVVVPSMFTHVQQEDFMKELWWKLSKWMTRGGLWSERGSAELPSRCQRYSQGLVEEEQALEVEQQNGQSKLGRRKPILGEGMGWGGIRAPPLHIQTSTSPPPLALHNPILLMIISTAPWRSLNYNPSLRNPRAGHGDVMPPCRQRKNWGSKFGLRWMKSWVMNQTCLQTFPSS